MDGSETWKSHSRRKSIRFFETYMNGCGLDIGFDGGGQDPKPVLPSAIGVDLDYPGYDGKILPFSNESQDYVYSSHCLEHIYHPLDAIQEWFRVVKTSGFLILVVPHQYLYEKREWLPSRWNRNHKRFYTPSRLLSEVERALEPNSYRVRMLCDSDSEFDYSRGPEVQSVGEYQIEVVLEKLKRPTWKLDSDGILGSIFGSLRMLYEKLRASLHR